MKTTIDIPASELEEAMQHAGARTKREAVVAAIVEYNRRRRRERLVSQLGTFGGVPSAREIIRRRRQR